MPSWGRHKLVVSEHPGSGSDPPIGSNQKWGVTARTYRKPSYHLLTMKQSPLENPRSYVQRFNAKSLKVDIPDEKFSITAFIAGLGVLSKDLMFSISKNPQASMVEVLTKAEKYINREESLLSKRENSSAQREKSKGEKKRE